MLEKDSKQFEQNPSLREVFEQLKGTEREVKVDTKEMPVELDSILEFVGEKDLVLKNVDNIVFGVYENFESNSSNFQGENDVYINALRKVVWPDELDIFDLVVYEAKKLELLDEGIFENNCEERERVAVQKQLEVLRKFQGSYCLNKNGPTHNYIAGKIQKLEENLN